MSSPRFSIADGGNAIAQIPARPPRILHHGVALILAGRVRSLFGDRIRRRVKPAGRTVLLGRHAARRELPWPGSGLGLQLCHQAGREQLLQHGIDRGPVIREETHQLPLARHRSRLLNHAQPIHAPPPIRRELPFQLFAVALVLGQSLDAAPQLPARLRGERFQKILDPLANDYPGIHADISASSSATS